MPSIDINCDLAEGEPIAVTQELMGLISSANICCGVHAGGREAMRSAVELAAELGIQAGAHPGLAGHFGRGATIPSPNEFFRIVEDQVAKFVSECEAAKILPSHIKLHGTLYHLAEKSPSHGGQIVTLLLKWKESFVTPRLFAIAGGALAGMARASGCEVYEEAFLDRAYSRDGTLIPRDSESAMLTDPIRIRERFERIRSEGRIETIDGHPLFVRPQTLCVHGDNPQALAILREIRSANLPDLEVGHEIP